MTIQVIEHGTPAPITEAQISVAGDPIIIRTNAEVIGDHQSALTAEFVSLSAARTALATHINVDMADAAAHERLRRDWLLREGNVVAIAETLAMLPA